MQVNLRRERRTQVGGIYSLTWRHADGLSHSVQARGKDLSDSGICVACELPLRPGAIVFIEGPGGSPSGYSIVRHCTRAGGFNHLGLEFSEETKTKVHATPVETTDYYEFLQISPKAGAETIHRVYRFMAARLHPDNPQTGDLEQFLLLNQVYQVLSDPQRRAEYDASRQQREAEPNPIFEINAFINGIEGEVNRRLAVLALLYNKRRMSSHDPVVSLWDLEQRMALPREYLDFATWYLKSKGYITIADNSDFALTASGVDYVEANAEKNPMLLKMLSAGRRTTGFGSDREEDRRRPAEGSNRLEAGEMKSNGLEMDPGQNGSAEPQS